jgi:hypothetical protein
MSTTWLNGQLASTSDAVVDGGNPILAVTFAGRTELVYCPDSDEYRITADVARKAKDLGATVIAYSSSWCATTYEGKEYAKSLDINIMPYAAFFKYLKRKGVKFKAEEATEIETHKSWLHWIGGKFRS